MPPIRSVSLADDFLEIVSHTGTFTLTRANFLPSLLAQGPQAVEDHINNQIDALLIPGGGDPFGCFVRVHVFATSPVLKWTCICSKDPIPRNWWTIHLPGLSLGASVGAVTASGNG